jgi:hypothetical protein
MSGKGSAMYWKRAPLTMDTKRISCFTPSAGKTRSAGWGGLKSKSTKIKERCETLNQAQEAAADKARALGFPEYFVLEPPEKLEDQKSDGVYLVTVQTRHEAVAV